MRITERLFSGFTLRLGVLAILSSFACAGFAERCCAADFAQPAAVVSLAGQWRFELDSKNAGIAENWFQKDLPESVRLPGSLDENRKGIKNKRKPDLNRLSRLYEYTGPAWYQRDIEVPREWKGKRVVLFLERCHWETQVWLDGKPLGMQESLCVPHEHELGFDLQPGTHKLTVRVDNTIKHNVGGMAHSITEETQTNWNGIVGRIELRATPPVWIESIQTYPDIKMNVVRIKASVRSRSKTPFRLALRTGARGSSQAATKFLEDAGFEGEKTLEAGMLMGGEKPLWDEFSPTLCDLTATLTTKDTQQPQQDTFQTSFGMRDFGVRDKRLVMNDRNVFIRGTLECCIFPRTGYPPTDVESWLRIFKICKSYGLNSMRFHSWCPPEAAFVAADQMGFLLQVEAPQWAGNVGKETSRDQFIEAEVLRILDTYGNHPSFAMLCMGNELRGDAEFPQKLVLLGREHDARHIYTSSTAWSFGPNNMYNVALVRGLHGPTTDADFRDADAKSAVPIISHELAQWAVYPNLDEIPKYNGVMRARNFELIRDDLKAKHLLDQAAAFTQATGKLSAELYKEEIESMLRTPGHGGFQLLDLHDFPGQGTAVVGMLDAFWDSKGIIAPEAFRRFCAPTAPLLRIKKRTFTNDEVFTAQAQLAHFGPRDIENATAQWSIVDSGGSEVASGTLPNTKAPTGDLTDLGDINVPLAKVTAPSELTVTVSLKGTSAANDWHIWVYPSQTRTTTPSDVVVTQSLDEAFSSLKAGKKVLLLASSGSLVKSRQGSFTPVFWSPILFPRQAFGTMGILCNPKHPALAGFPTDAYTNWQWYDLLGGKSRTMVLDGTPASFRPVVQVIDNFTKNSKLGILVESRVGEGRLMVCSLDLSNKLEERPAARQLLRSILDYMGSAGFQPRQRLTASELGTFLGESEKPVLQSLGAKVIMADSEDTEHNNITSNVIDGDPGTIWHTQYESAEPTYPHEIRIDMQKSIELAGFKLLPRQDMENGWFSNYEFYVSEDGKDWGTPAAKGSLKESAEQKSVNFDKPRRGRFIRLVALSGTGGRPWAAIAEMDVIAATAKDSGEAGTLRR